MRERDQNLTEPRCSCGALTRPKFASSKGGKNSRSQSPRWRVCGNGHQIVKKR